MLDKVKFIAERVEPVGSRVTCNPPPVDTDQDFLVLLDPDKWGEFCELMEVDGYDMDGSRVDDDANDIPIADRFLSFRLGDVNLITTRSEVFFRRFMAASSVAKRLNLLNKSDRVALFQAVLYGNDCHASEDPFAELVGELVF